MAAANEYKWRRDKDGLGVWEHRGKVAVAGFGHSPVDRRWDGVSMDKTIGAYSILACEKAMADAGVELVTGTDAPAVPGMLPGFSLHDDFDELEASGLTRFQVLSAATREPGAFIARTKGGAPFGIVAPGNRADLVLSASNPLAGLSTLRKPIGVMVRGEWRDAAALQALADNVRESYRRASAQP